MGYGLKQTLDVFKEDIQVVNEHMKRCSLSLIIREMQSKSQWDITSYPLSMKVRESESEVAQWCPTLFVPMDCSLPGSSIHGILRQEYWSGLPFPSHQKMKTSVSQDVEKLDLCVLLLGIQNGAAAEETVWQFLKK